MINLRLFISGRSKATDESIQLLKGICERELRGEYELEIIDATKNPELALTDQIIATPTLLRKLPPPLRSVIGRLTEEKIIEALELKPR